MLKAADWKVAPFASGTLTSQNNRGIEVGDSGLNLVGFLFGVNLDTARSRV